MEREDIPLEKIEAGDKIIYLLGTAHISEESVRDVIDAIESLRPDAVAIELDDARMKRLTNQDKQWQEMDMFSVIKKKKAMFLLSSIVLSSFQRRLGESLSVAPGAEMLTAIEESEKHNIPIVLADRSAETTLKRAWNKSSFFGRQKILATLLSAIFTKETVSEEELKELKQKSTQGQMLEEISKFLPDLKEVLLDERDEYLATNIYNAEGNVILAVLGAAHVPGIKKRIEEHIAPLSPSDSTTESKTERSSVAFPVERLEALNVIPPKKNKNILGFIIPFIVLGLFAYGFYRGGAENLFENFKIWWLINGGLSLIGSLIALAHPMTMLISFIAAPLTSLNPFIGVGILTGLCETFFRKPRVKDFEELKTLSLSVKTLYKNRVTRILIVLFTTTLGSAVGTFLGGSIIAANI